MDWGFTLFLSQQPSQLKHCLQGFYVASTFLKRHMFKPLPQLKIVNLVPLFPMHFKKLQYWYSNLKVVPINKLFKTP